METKTITESEIFGDIKFWGNLKFTAEKVIVHGDINAGGDIVSNKNKIEED
jgi:hypothetical protein